MAPSSLMGVCFELSLVPYNGFLPEITDERTINRVSALGFRVGIHRRIGAAGDRLGNRPLRASRSACSTRPISIGRAFCCWGSGGARSACRRSGFSATAASRPSDASRCWRAARTAVGEVGRTLANLRRYPVLALFLLAFLFYNDGMQTVITQVEHAGQQGTALLDRRVVSARSDDPVDRPARLAAGRLALRSARAEAGAAGLSGRLGRAAGGRRVRREQSVVLDHGRRPGVGARRNAVGQPGDHGRDDAAETRRRVLRLLQRLGQGRQRARARRSSARSSI